jgi:hypothetical protein
MNKSILFVSPVPPPYGGIGNWLLVVTDYLKNNNLGIEFEVINTSPNKRSMDGRTLWDRIVVSGFSMLKSIKNFKKEISKKKYDCIHVNTSGSLAIIRDYIILKNAKKKEIKDSLSFTFWKNSFNIQVKFIGKTYVKESI